MKTVITYGTFDLFHVGHLRLLERLKAMGDRLIVAVSTDEFNALKNKRAFLSYEHRAEIVRALRCVDQVIPEYSWEQKVDDIRTHHVDLFGIGDDWTGHFDFLRPHCEVVYLPRTAGISSTLLKQLAGALNPSTIERLAEAQSIVSRLLTDLTGLK